MIKPEIRNKFPQYADYDDQAFAAAVWNQHYKDKLQFEDFAKRIGYTIIPGEPLVPSMPTEQTMAEKGIDLIGDLAKRISQNVAAVPAVGIAAGGIAKLAQLPGATGRMQAAGRAAQAIVPKTGGELARQVGTAAAVAPAGYAAEQLARPVAKAAGEVLPPFRKPEAQESLAQALRIPLGVGAEIGTSLGLGQLGRTASTALARRPAGIPPERLETARKIETLGGRYPTQELLRGRDVSKVMEVYNRRYNKLLGLPEKTDFGTRELRQARSNLSSEYDNILANEKVVFDPEFFGTMKALLDRQRDLAQTGVMFAESRPIINTLSQIANLPASLRARIDALRNIPPETQDIGATQNALKVIDDALGFLQNQTISMDARIYNELRSDLGNAAYRTSDANRAMILRDMQKAFDDAADASLPKDKVERLGTVRNRWENLQILEEAQKGREPGMITPQDVARVTTRRDASGMIYGDKELYDIGKEGLSMPVRPEAAGREPDPSAYLPTQVGGYRQKAAIGERAADLLLGGARKRALLRGEVTPEEMQRRQQLQQVRAVGGGAMRAFEPEGEGYAIDERQQPQNR